VLDVDELLWSFVFRSKDKVWVWIAMNRERPEKSSPLPAVIAPKTPVGYSGIAYRLLMKEAIVFSDYWSAYRAVIPSEQQRPVGKEMGKRFILSVGIIPYGNT